MSHSVTSAVLRRVREGKGGNVYTKEERKDSAQRDNPTGQSPYSIISVNHTNKTQYNKGHVRDEHADRKPISTVLTCAFAPAHSDNRSVFVSRIQTTYCTLLSAVRASVIRPQSLTNLTRIWYTWTAKRLCHSNYTVRYD